LVNQRDANCADGAGGRAGVVRCRCCNWKGSNGSEVEACGAIGVKSRQAQPLSSSFGAQDEFTILFVGEEPILSDSGSSTTQCNLAALPLTLLEPWAGHGRAAALDSTPLRTGGGVWHKKHRENGEIPYS